MAIAPTLNFASFSPISIPNTSLGTQLSGLNFTKENAPTFSNLSLNFETNGETQFNVFAGSTKVNKEPVVVLPGTATANISITADSTFADIILNTPGISLTSIDQFEESVASNEQTPEVKTLCPTCHSDIGVDPLGDRKQGSQGIDEFGLPVPRWSDDPLKTTPTPLSGNVFEGNDRIKAIHIQELQASRASEEAQAGVEDLTDFTEVESDDRILASHINELRESTEKILAQSGTSLGDYFTLNQAGEEEAPGPNDEAKSEWTDVVRGLPYIHKDGTVSGTFNTSEQQNRPSPSLPENQRIRAIHVEDLRHPIQATLWREFWSVNEQGKEIFKTTVEDTSDFTDDDDISGAGVLPFVTPGDCTNCVFSTRKRHVIRSDTVSIDFNNIGQPEHGFDIFDTDDGNKYLFEQVVGNGKPFPLYGEIVKDEEGNDVFTGPKVWIVTSDILGIKLENIEREFFQVTEGCPVTLAFVETAVIDETKGTAKLGVTGLTEGKVAALRDTAKTLVMEVTAESKKFPVSLGSGFIGAEGNSELSVTHSWQFDADELTPFSADRTPFPDTFPAFDNESISITKDTEFKFHIKLSGVIKRTRFNSGINNVENPGDQPTFPDLEQLEQSLNENPFFLNLDEQAIGRFELRLTLNIDMIGIGRKDFLFIFRFRNPREVQSIAQEQVGPLEGQQSFTFQGQICGLGVPQQTIIFLGEPGDGVYNFSINIDDLLSATKELDCTNTAGKILFPYISHKIEEDGKIIENPAATVVSFKRVRMFLSSRAEAQGISSSGGPSSKGFPECKFESFNNKFIWDNYEIETKAEVNALRIENNPNVL